MRVLNLVTSDEARFFNQQVEILEGRGVEQTTISLPTSSVEGNGRRSVVDYLRLLPPTIYRSMGEYDLLHANSGLTAPAAVLQCRLPTVVSLWGTDLMGRYGPITKQFTKRCDSVIVMSEEMEEQYGHDCHVIPHGIDLERFTPQPREESAERLEWDPDTKHVLFPYPRERAVKDFPRAKRIVSEASCRIDDDVELHTVTGVPHESMSLYMNAADVLLLTSEREGSPNSVKEAMACNLPVVSTPVGDVPERLVGVSPSVVSDDDATLVSGVTDVLASGRRSNGREKAHEVSITRMADQLMDVYRDVATS
ncbi:glycosyltransferase family 4 protein [Halorubrum sp. DTA98]|uniref:glycosyltransferase family 4 protein n=1 Tax=Halorubrum sp. DTA98 TaxID=3402163 RepID=UPI003AAB524F